MGPLGCISKIGGHMLSTMSVEYCLIEEAVLNPFLELSNIARILSENDSQFCSLTAFLKVVIKQMIANCTLLRYMKRNLIPRVLCKKNKSD